tara:strand:- start:17 stop:151 length:135 start_codon:yes stop_codon:yes gene_type:complete
MPLTNHPETRGETHEKTFRDHGSGFGIYEHCKCTCLDHQIIYPE